MNILITGASGLIGQAVRNALLAAGHRVHAVCRRPPADTHPALTWHTADITRLQPEDWLGWLDEVTLVINAAGIFQDDGTQTCTALHVEAAQSLFEACVLSGVDRLIQISALGADVDAPTAYARSKGLADAELRTLPMNAIVVRPSLVYADHGASSRSFRHMAALPCLAIPHDAGPVQPIHLDDLAAAILRLVEHPKPASLPRILNAVGPRPLPFADYLQALRTGMGLAAAPVWRLPTVLANAGARLAERLFPGSLVRRESLRLLRAGNCADAAPLQTLLGRPLRDPSTFTHTTLSAHSALAAEAHWAIYQPLLRASLAFVWLWTAWVSLAYPAAGFALLHDMGLPTPLHGPTLLLGAGLDALFGGLTLLRPGKRLWQAQAGLILAYTLLITLFLPAWWLHPFGAVSKNVPLLALLAVLAAAPHRHQPTRP